MNTAPRPRRAPALVFDLGYSAAMTIYCTLVGRLTGHHWTSSFVLALVIATVALLVRIAVRRRAAAEK